MLETRCITVINWGSGKLTVQSNGLVAEGDWRAADFEKRIDRLSDDGWTMVGCMERQPKEGERTRMELYFRRQIPE